MHKLLLDLPTRLETERLYLRSYQPGDGAWYYPMSLRNQPHLARYEAGNAVNRIKREEDAEIVVRGFAADWVARAAFFMAAFCCDTQEFAAQLYIGVVNWELPEFEVGYFADVAHEGQGYVTEAVRAALGFIFEHLGAERVRLECDDTNLRSLAVAERCGMVREAHFRLNKRHEDGTRSGTVIYGLLRSEFAVSKA
ncbi:MAG: GNAT family protein [Chloroflexi bacterium]|nr:GNAT family protein [Chloroflexota bacterium]